MTKLKRLLALNFLKSSFVKNVVTLSFGAVVSQAINFIFLPILSRLYDPIDFGLFYSFVGITQTITLISTLKYEKSIILPKDNEEGGRLVVLTLVIAFVFSIVVALILIVLKLFYFNFGEVGKYFFLIPVSIISYASLSALGLWYQREERFKLISIVSIGQSLLIVGISILLGVFNFGQNGLIYGYVFGCAVLVIFAICFNYNRFYILFDRNNKTKLVEVFKKYIDFPKYYLPYDLLSTGSIAIIPVIIASYYSKNDCGLFSMAYRILSIPFIVIGSAVSNVFMVNAMKLYNNHKNFDTFFIKTFTRILLIAITIYSIAFVFGGSIIPFFLGNKWVDIDVFIKILSVMLFFEFLSSVFKSNTYIIVEKQKTGMIIQIISTLFNISCLIFFSSFGIKTSLMIFTISASFFSCLNLCISYSFSKKL